MAKTQVSDIDVQPYFGAHDQDSADWIGEVVLLPSGQTIGAREPEHPPSAHTARREHPAGSGEDR